MTVLWYRQSKQKIFRQNFLNDIRSLNPICARHHSRTYKILSKACASSELLLASGFLFCLYQMEQKKALGQISSLIKLLTDRDEFVRNRVRDQLVELGEDALPFLEMATRGEDESLRIQSHLVIQNILPHKLAEKFRQLAKKGLSQDVDLEAGMMLILEFGYPESDPEECRQKLDDLAEELGGILHANTCLLYTSDAADE